MPVEFMQCPKCGSPLEVQPTATSATCAYCGSRLRVTRGASGHPLAVLGDIKDDTAIIAKQTAIDHLRRQLPEILQHRSRLEEEARAQVKAAEVRVWANHGDSANLDVLGPLLIFLGALLFVLVPVASARPIYFVPGVGCMCFGFLLAYMGHTRARLKHGLVSDSQRPLRDKYDSLIAGLDEKIESTQARIADLETDMDRLAREL